MQEDLPFVDYTFSCPLIVGPIVPVQCDPYCVANLADCTSACPTATPFLCPSGVCVNSTADCVGDNALNPCEEYCGFTCAPMATCETSDLVCPVSLARPELVLPLLWVMMATIAPIMFCCLGKRCNRTQRMEKRDESQMSLRSFQDGKFGDDVEEASLEVSRHTSLRQSTLRDPPQMVQKGYKNVPMGTVLYRLCLLTAFLMQLFFGYLTSCYYSGQCFTDQTTVILFVFIIAWMVSACYYTGLRWYSDLRVHFRVRCPLGQAEYVQMWVESKRLVVHMDPSLARWQKRAQMPLDFLNRIFRMIYSDIQPPPAKDGYFVTCKVQDDDDARTFTFQLRRFVYNPDRGVFEAAEIEVGRTLDDLHRCAAGLSESEAAYRLKLVGPNNVALSPPSLLQEMIKESTRPFYVYQVLIVWPWFVFDYWTMGSVYVIVYLCGALAVIWVNYKNAKTIYSLAKAGGDCQCIRGGVAKTIPVEDLVPGDLVQMQPGSIPCDLVLLRGQVIVDESFLTGESMPVQKIQLQGGSDVYSDVTHKSSTLFAGSAVLESEQGNSLALVVRSGADTSKADQVRQILFREQPLFKFDIQVRVVLLILSVYAIFGFFLVLYLLRQDLVAAWYYGIWVSATCLPPLLPTVFVVAVSLSSDRLTTRGVVCSDPSRILMAGKVRVFCFDKTGTLTKQGLDFQGAMPVVAGRFAAKATCQIDDEDSWILRGMTVCHSLSLSVGNILIGNAVDKQMFLSTGYTLTPGVEGGPDRVSKAGGRRTLIVKRWEFDHARATMAAVAQSDSQYHAFVKGSFEALRKICVSVPDDYIEVAESMAKNGSYVLAMAGRPLDAEEQTLLERGQDFGRERIERELTFYGFISFRNELKPDTTEALQKLREGAIRTIMITGDHPLTGLYIAHECGLTVNPVLWGREVVDGKVVWVGEDGKSCDLPSNLESYDLMITGAVFGHLRDCGELSSLFHHVRVFARMTPQDKIDVVERFVRKGTIVGMCGDGGNDCGALRAAHVGVALSDAEASVVSPFTGATKSCMSVVDVLLEGRCGLYSSFAGYKYMVTYGMIETANQLTMAFFHISLSEWCWIFMDGVWVLLLSFTLVRARPLTKLADRRPPSSLLGWITMSSVLGNLGLNFFFLFFGFVLLYAQDWYKCRMWDWEAANLQVVTSLGDNYESTVIFLVTGCQYMISAAVYNFGSVHREPWMKNYGFAVLVLVLFGLQFAVALIPSKLSCVFHVNCLNEDRSWGLLNGYAFMQNPWNTTLMPVSFRWMMFFVMLANTISALLWEYLVVLGPVAKILRTRWPNVKYLKL